MADAKSPQYCQDVSWIPLSCRWPSVIFNQHFGLPPLLEPRDLSWMEDIFRRLGTSSWPGYVRSAFLGPLLQASGPAVFSKPQRELSGGVSEVAAETCRWKISLDVNHFAPSEISVKIQDGFLEIAGKHEERQDGHGFIARSFTRKYNLPGGIDVENLQTSLSADGILTVEAPFPSIPLPADVIIPIQVETGAQTIAGKQQDGDKPQDGIKPESFDGKTPESSVTAGHPDAGKVTERDQQTVSDVDPSRVAQPQSIAEAASGLSVSGREQVGEPIDGREKDKEGRFQEMVEGIQRDGESADKPQAPETPDTIASEQGDQAEVVQLLDLEGEEGCTGPAVMREEQSTFGQGQELFNPQLVLQKKIDVGKM